VRITDATKTEEINNLRPYKDSVVSLQQAVQKESLERTQLQIHYDVHVKEIERLVALVKEKENHIALGTHSLTYLLAHSLTYSLTHSLSGYRFNVVTFRVK
jgi:hypothetical protein